MSAVKTILVAHHQTAVRDRFAAALADARQAFVLADTEEAARAALGEPPGAISLAIVDLGLAPDAVAFVRALRTLGGASMPITVFSGSLTSAALVPGLGEAGVAGYINEHAATPQILPALAPHLFPDNFDRRTSPRVALGVPVSCRAGQQIMVAHALNVSRGGLAVRTMTPLAPQTLVVVKFRLPGGHADIEAAGRVAWSDRQVGMGIQFDHVHTGGPHQEDAQGLIDQFVDAYRA
jgi:uncharacterized protein (TIGR02266 family)